MYTNNRLNSGKDGFAQVFPVSCCVSPQRAWQKWGQTSTWQVSGPCRTQTWWVFFLPSGHILIPTVNHRHGCSAVKRKTWFVWFFFPKKKILGADPDDHLQTFAVRWRFFEGFHVRARASDRLTQRLTKAFWAKRFRSERGISPASPS